MVEYIEIREANATPALFEKFDRYQKVTKCLRNVGGQWVAKDIAFEENWDSADHERKARDINNTVCEGGYACGAFEGGALKGLCLVSGKKIGSRKQYMVLESLHVSADMRGMGIGRQLFERAAKWAGENGAEKLYISTHSAVESQKFYAAVGCVDAQEPDAEHVKEEPCDRQMEYKIGNSPNKYAFNAGEYVKYD